MGLMVVKETRERALALAVPGAGAAATCWRRRRWCPDAAARIDDPTTVARCCAAPRGRGPRAGPTCRARARPSRATCSRCATREDLAPEAADPDGRALPAPGAVHRERRARDRGRGAAGRCRGAQGPRARAERLVRHVNALLEKKPTVSLPSALEVLRTRVGDCNEHTALYVAMARAAGHPRPHRGGPRLPAAAPSTTTPGPRCTSTGRAAAASGCPWTPRSTSSPPTPPTCAWPAAAWTSRRRSLPAIGRARMTRPGGADPGGRGAPSWSAAPAPDLRPLELAAPRRETGGGHCWSPPAR